MCEQCKDLVGCRKNNCTGTPVGRPSVAELLAQVFSHSANGIERTSGRILSRREILDHHVATS